jgi:hypothetical protein
MEQGQHYLNSSFREKLIEHLFIGELLKISWQRHDCSLEIAVPEVDKGYDVIAETDGVLRHIQLKTAQVSSTTSNWKISMNLAKKPCGCLILIYFDEKLKLGPFYFFGGKAGERLPDVSGCKIARHSKGDKEGYKAERANIRALQKGQFTARYDSIEKLYDELFTKAASA